jgi:hypothetical protein
MTFVTFDSAKVVPYQELKPSGRAGLVLVMLPNGNTFSGHHGDGQGNERPGISDGPWEQGQVSGNAVTYLIGGLYETWLIVPVDKLP